MKYQTNKALGPFLNKWGCHIACILQKVEKACGGSKKFTNEDVVTIYKRGIAEGHIQKEEFNPDGTAKIGCLVLDKDGSGASDGEFLFNFGAELLGVSVRAKSYRREKADYVPKQGEEEILELKRHGYNGSHFVSGTNIVGSNWKKEIEFDPIEGGSNCARDGWIESKRILTLTK